MSRKAIGISFLFLAVSFADSDDQPSYDVARIPSGLRVDAAAVIREDWTTFELLSRSKATETHVEVYTIFRKEGRDFGEIELSYDRFRSVDDLRGALYDEHGKEIRTLSSDDVKDESDIAAYSLYEDARVRSAEMYHDSYPYTVMFTYRIDHDGFLGFPSWVAQPSEEPVEHTRFEVVLPDSESLRYWVSVDSLKPRVTFADGRTHYVWEASGLKELSEDELSEDLEQRTWVVRTAPREFELGDRAGRLDQWKSFGAWCENLWKGKTQLPPEAAHEVDSSVAGCVRTVDKVKSLYQFLQRKTRYMNVTLGIGGWEPYDATYVHERGYGDCKALSNYMVALLARAGIRAFAALIYAGGSRSWTIETFPASSFNHVIVCVPLGKDTVWLECTSQTAPFGHLGDFTENRPALLITPDGGDLVRTPASGPEDNRVDRTGRIVLGDHGSATEELCIDRKGSFTENARHVMTYGDSRAREEWVAQNLSISGSSLRSYSLSGITDHADLVRFSLEAEIPRFASSSGMRLFFQPDIAHRGAVPPKERKVRKSPIRFSTAYKTTDSITYVLPAGYRIEALPAAVQLIASFGTFESSSVAAGDSAIVFTRVLEIRTPILPAERYQEYQRFMKDIVKADKAQVVAVRKL
jgi:hypothetical protein